MSPIQEKVKKNKEKKRKNKEKLLQIRFVIVDERRE
jgi:hypothetical protein